MFSKQNQTDPSQAREAVKKQLLRSLMQQVVDEVSTMDGTELDEMVASMIGEIDYTSLKERVNEQVAARFRSGVEQIDVDATIAECQEQSMLSVDDSLESKIPALDEAALAVRIQSLVERKFNAQVEELSFDDVIEREKERAIQMAQELFSEKLALVSKEELRGQLDSLDTQALQAALEEAANTFVASKIESFDLGSITTQAKNELESSLRTSVTEQLDSIDEAIVGDVQRHAEQLIADAIERNAELMKADINDRVSASTESLVEIATKQVETQIAAVQQDVEHHIAEQLKRATEADHSMAANISSSLVGDADWNEALSIRVMNEVAVQIGKEVQNRIVKSPVVVQETVDLIREGSDVFDSIASKVRNELIAQVSKISLSQLDDVDRIAKEARDHIAFDNDSLVAAAAMLRNKVLQDIARRTTLSFGNTDEVTDDAKQWINDEDPSIQVAVAEVSKMAKQVISAMTRQRLADTESIVSQVAPEFSEESVQIRNAVHATREALVGQISEYTLEALRNVEQVSAEAASSVPSEHETVQKAVSATVSLLVDDVVRLSEIRLKSTEKISSAARNKMPDEIPAVVQAAHVLENMLLAEVADNAGKRLFEVDQAADKALTFVDAKKQQQAIQELLLDNILQSIAAQALSELKNADKYADGAFEKVDLTHEFVTGATSLVRTKLVSEIADMATARIEDVEGVSKESRRLIANNNANLVGATARLYEMLVEDVARQTMNLIAESDKTSADVMARIQKEDEVINRVQEIVHDQMIERLLAHALDEIKVKVTDTSNDAEKVFFRSAMNVFVGAQSSPQATPQAAPQPQEEIVPETKKVDEVVSEAPKASVKQDVEPTDDAVQDRNDWTLLSDMDDQEEQPSNAKSASQSWSVSEFKPTPEVENIFEANDSSTGDGFSAKGGVEIEINNAPSSKNAGTFYLYGIAAAADAKADVFDGIEGLEAKSSVITMKCGSLSAIVSRLDNPAFSPYMIRKSMKNNSWLKDQVRQHAGVLAEAKGMMTIVPLRFGTVFTSEKEVQSFVQKREKALLETLSRLKDKNEFGIRVLCDVDKLGASISTSGSEFSQSISQLSPSVAEFIKGQLHMDDADFSYSSIEKAIESIVSRIDQPLQHFATEAISKNNGNGFATDLADVVLNSTYLVPLVQEKNFRSKITEIAQELNPLGVTIEVSGPWPPYHFVDIDMDDFPKSISTEMPV